MIGLASFLAFAAAVELLMAWRAATSPHVLGRLPDPRAEEPVDDGSPDLVVRLGRTKVGARLAGPNVVAALDGAGWTHDPARLGGVRLLTGVAPFALALVVPFPGPVLAPLLGVVGLRLPLFVVARAAKRRRAAVDAEIPQLLDLLAAGSSAGLAAPLALRRAIDGLQGPLRDELARTLDTVDLGARWRDELRALAGRLALPDLTRAVAAVTRTESLGSSLADATAELAATVRDARRAAVTERARTAPVKMLFPLVFLVLPAFLLLTVVPVLLTTLQSIR